MTAPIEQKSPQREEAELQKLQLEAAKIKSDLADAKLARKMKKAEIRRQEAEAVTAEQIAMLRGFERNRQERAEQALSNSDAANYTYHFNTYVDDDSCYALVETLNQWHRDDPDSEWNILIDSGGGEIRAGSVLYDELVNHSLRGGGTHHIRATVRGMAASMATVLLQAADERVMGAHAQFMLHELSLWIGTSRGDLIDGMERQKLLTNMLHDTLVARSNLTRKKFDKLVHRRDWWLTAEEALKHGFIDRIG